MSKDYAIHDFRGVTAHRYVLLKYISVKIAKKKAVFTVHQNVTSALVHFFCLALFTLRKHGRDMRKLLVISWSRDTIAWSCHTNTCPRDSQVVGMKY